MGKISLFLPVSAKMCINVFAYDIEVEAVFPSIMSLNLQKTLPRCVCCVRCIIVENNNSIYHNIQNTIQ